MTTTSRAWLEMWERCLVCGRSLARCSTCGHVACPGERAAHHCPPAYNAFVADCRTTEAKTS